MGQFDLSQKWAHIGHEMGTIWAQNGHVMEISTQSQT